MGGKSVLNERGIDQAMLILLGLVLLIKIGLLLALGPAIFPDSAHYLSLGEQILTDPSWLHDGQWDSDIVPGRLFRPYGYPLLVAAARLVAGSQFGLVLAVLQALLSVAALGAVAVVGQRMIADRRLRLAILSLCATSGFLLFDMALLTDSFYGTLFITTFCVHWQPSLGLALLLGILWALSMSLRDVAIYHAVLPLMGLLLATRCHSLGKARSATMLGAFLLPVAAMTILVVGWNYHRTGHAFYSITGGVNWLWPSFNIADRGLANPFECADDICRTVRRIGKHHGWDGVLAVTRALWDENKLDPRAFGRMTHEHFLAVLKTHPLAFLASVLGNLQFAHLADLVFNPVANLNKLFQLHSTIDHKLFPGARECWKSLLGGEPSALPLLLLNILPAAMSILGLTIITVLAPLRAIGTLRRQPAEGLDHKGRLALSVLFFWGAAALFLVSYSIVHMEMRHALPTVPLLLLVFGATVDGWITQRQVDNRSSTKISQ
jgi:hypothetical protein